MKKIILLLILPFITLMAIDFTMTRDGLIAPSSINNNADDATDPVTSSTTVTATETSGTNFYLEPVDIPTYDNSNSEHFLISSKSDWSHINDADKFNFYVKPGNYLSGNTNINITRSGTANKRRTIALYNGNDIHPGKLNTNQLANYALTFNNADYWTIDRPSAIDHGNVTRSIFFSTGSSHNIINRMFANNFFIAIGVLNTSNYNTIQNSRFDTMTLQSFSNDVSAIQIVESGSTAPTFTVLGTKIIANEFVNCKPGRANRYYGSQSNHGQYANFDGLIFDSNTIEYTSALYTDGSGNYTPTGNYMAGESAGFSFKGGSNDSNNPIKVTNNHVWGYRPADPTFANLSGAGHGFLVYMGSKYVHIEDNVIFDGTAGIVLSDRYDEPYGSQYAIVKNNLIVDCGSRPGAFGSTSLQVGQAYHADIRNNTIINPSRYSSMVWYNYAGNYVGQNTVVNPDLGQLIEGNNYSWDGKGTDTIYNTATEGGYTEDYSFTTDKFTNKPRTITLKKVI